MTYTYFPCFQKVRRAHIFKPFLHIFYFRNWLRDMIQDTVKALLSWPLSSLTSILISFALLLIVTFPSSLVIDEEKMRAYEEEIRAWEEAKRRAILKKDRKMYTKVLRRETRIRRLREEIEKMRLKASGISFVMWIISLNLLLRGIGNLEVVYFPLLNMKLTLVGWYFVLSFWLYPLTTRVNKVLSRGLRGIFKGVRKR